MPNEYFEPNEPSSHQQFQKSALLAGEILAQTNPNVIASSIVAANNLIFLTGKFFKYANGKYSEISDHEVASIIKYFLGNSFNVQRRNEICACLEAEAFLKFESLNIPKNLINLKNGLLDLSSFEIQAHDKQYHFLTQIDSEYLPEATSPGWIQFLNEVLGDDPPKIKVLQEFFGYCLSPLTDFEKALMLIGDGANGKSVVLNILQGLFGNENCSAVQMDNFDNRNYRAEFFGKMVNISTETNVKAHVYEGIFKQLVSGESIAADRKYGHPFKFNNFCKLSFSFNEPPRIDDKTNGFYRRILMIPFNFTIPEEKQNRQLSVELLQEKPGILLWAIEGLKRLRLQNMFTQAPSVLASVEAYRKENNNLISFVEDCCLVGAGYTVSKTDLYRAYVSYCKQNGFQPQSKIRFGKNLQKTVSKITDDKNDRGRFWCGLILETDFDTIL